MWELAAPAGTKERKKREGLKSRRIGGLGTQATRSELRIIRFRQAPKPTAQQVSPSGPGQLRFSQPACRSTRGALVSISLDSGDLKMAAQSAMKVVLKRTTKMSLNEWFTSMLKNKQPMPVTIRASMQQ